MLLTSLLPFKYAQEIVSTQGEVLLDMWNHPGPWASDLNDTIKLRSLVCYIVPEAAGYRKAPGNLDKVVDYLIEGGTLYGLTGHQLEMCLGEGFEGEERFYKALFGDTWRKSEDFLDGLTVPILWDLTASAILAFSTGKGGIRISGATFGQLRDLAEVLRPLRDEYPRCRFTEPTVIQLVGVLMSLSHSMGVIQEASKDPTVI